MKKKLIGLIMAMMMLGSCMALTACGGSSESTGDPETAETTQATEVTEETVHAADPMTDEELEADDSDGCIEDSEDLLY